MAAIRTIAVCHPQIPFSDGGQERLSGGLVDAFNARGYEAALVSVPFRWDPRAAIGRSCLAWRLLDLSESNGRPIDLVVATKFPSYAVRHPRKVTWLVQQFRQVYDLFGTPYSDFADSAEDRETRTMIRLIDDRTLGECTARFALSQVVADRLKKYNGLDSAVMHSPPRNADRFRSGAAQDYVLAVSRLDPLKRIGALIEALPFTDRALRAVIVGRGPEEVRLQALAAELGVADRVEFRGAVSFKDVVELYRHALAVFFAPYDEDYGYITVEAFLSGRPVVTAPDSGGPLEFVEDKVTGLVVPLEPELVGERLNALHADRKWARDMGAAGRARVRDLSWNNVVDRILESA